MQSSACSLPLPCLCWLFMPLCSNCLSASPSFLSFPHLFFFLCIPLLLLLYSPFTTALISHDLPPRSWFTQLHHNTKTQLCNIRWHPHLARNLKIQQVLQPVDPQAIPGLVRTQLDSEGDKEAQLGSASQLSQPSSTGNPPRGADHLGKLWASQY